MNVDTQIQGERIEQVGPKCVLGQAMRFLLYSGISGYLIVGRTFDEFRDMMPNPTTSTYQCIRYSMCSRSWWSRLDDSVPNLMSISKRQSGQSGWLIVRAPSQLLHVVCPNRHDRGSLADVHTRTKSWNLVDM